MGTPRAAAGSARRERTRRALVAATVGVVRARGAVTMPDVARVAQVSEATAYRHFADLPALLRAAEAVFWAEAAAGSEAGSAADGAPLNVVIDRVRRAAARTVDTVVAAQTAIRPLIAARVNSAPDEAVAGAGERDDGHRFALVRRALPEVSAPNEVARERLARMLAVVVSAENVYGLLDQRALPVDAARTVVDEITGTLSRATLPALLTDGTPGSADR